MSADATVLVAEHEDRLRQLMGARLARKDPSWSKPIGSTIIRSEIDVTEREARLVAKELQDSGLWGEMLEAERQRRAGTTEVLADDLDPDPGYEFEIREDGTYVFTFPGKAGAVIRTKAAVEQMLLDYTDSHTMEQVAIANGLTRNEFNGIRRAMGWTKTSTPVLREDIEAMTEEELTERLTAIKLRRATVKADRIDWRKTQADADRWRQYEAGTLEPLREAIEVAAANYEPPKARMVVRPKSARRYALVVSPTDLHVGKLHDKINGGGEAASLLTARKRLMEAVGDILASLPCAPEIIYLTVGGDWFNVDNSLNTTTRGTPQDSAATPSAIWAEGSTLARDLVHLLSSAAPVEVVHVPGNHDRMLGQVLADFLAAWFREDDRVTVREERCSYVAFDYGANMLLFHHGDGVGQANALAGLMAGQWPKLWGRTTHRFAFLGHLHHTKAKRVSTRSRRTVSERESYEIHEDRGIVAFTLPSLSADDRYHVHKGYVHAQSALLTVGLDFDDGWFLNLRSAVKPVRPRGAA